MDDYNPYQPPAVLEIGRSLDQTTQVARIVGPNGVVPRVLQLPQICVFTGAREQLISNSRRLDWIPFRRRIVLIALVMGPAILVATFAAPLALELFDILNGRLGLPDSPAVIIAALIGISLPVMIVILLLRSIFRLDRRGIVVRYFESQRIRRIRVLSFWVILVALPLPVMLGIWLADQLRVGFGQMVATSASMLAMILGWGAIVALGPGYFLRTVLHHQLRLVRRAAGYIEIGGLSPHFVASFRNSQAGTANPADGPAVTE